MTGFMLAAIFVSICCIVLLILPLIRTRASRSLQRTTQNIHYARQRLGELNQQLENASISAEDYESLKQEIESMLAKDIESHSSDSEQVAAESGQANGVVIALICTLIPFGAIVLYQLTGTPEAITSPAASTSPEAAQSPPTAQSIDSLVESLVSRLQQQPDDVEGWAILARTYLSLGRYQESIKANEKLIEIGGEDANVYAQMADAAALLAEGNLAGRPTDYVQNALRLNPEQPQALWLAGLSAAQQGRDDEARSYWNKLLPLLAGAPQQQQELREIIQQTLPPSETQARANDAARAAQTASAAAEAPSAVQPSGLRIRVQIADALKEMALPNETVFVFARAQSGPPAPLAVK
ncbi:MAG: c-type cytochrome biogenesis protein CcmI, partial [Arenicella sp.]|nr:c-type cytochrome biogenesis protein CcmI [Arenicella sp.]